MKKYSLLLAGMFTAACMTSMTAGAAQDDLTGLLGELGISASDLELPEDLELPDITIPGLDGDLILAKGEAGNGQFSYIAVTFHDTSLDISYLYSDSEVEVGDIVQYDGHISTDYCDPPVIRAEIVEPVGNVSEWFGEDTAASMGRLLDEASEQFGFWLTKADLDVYGISLGDLTGDKDVSILDVVTVQKNLLTGAPLTACGRLAADVDQNGVVDETDALNILKRVIDILPDFDALRA